MLYSPGAQPRVRLPEADSVIVAGGGEDDGELGSLSGAGLGGITARTLA